jgi:acyl transferase domain-containing protein/4'-phosphopantetheinyl transferase EntD
MNDSRAQFVVPKKEEDIAIVGMACLFPGADSPSQFWHNIVNKVESVGPPPAEWGPEFFVDSKSHSNDRVYTGTGGHLGDLGRFNPAKYGVMPTSVEGAEPDQFLALRCAFDALADAGFPRLPLNRQKTGVIIGRGLYINRGLMSWVMQGVMVDQVLEILTQLRPDLTNAEADRIKQELKKNLPPFNSETVPGLVNSVMCGRIANRLDLQGPAYTVDAACSSTLIAVEQAMRELRTGRCDAVIVGGVQGSSPAPIHQLFSNIEATSRSGHLAAFSELADGTLMGEGCGMLVLKRRGDAERDGHRIYALIKSVGVASDGKATGLLAPRLEGQILAVERAYTEGGIDRATIGLIEAHGTGTPKGDATEVQSLTACFGLRKSTEATIAMGSVKSMIGHLLPASASASLIKTALALHHRVLPPTLFGEKPNPELGLEKTPFYLSCAARPWVHGDRDTPRRAGVNAFGFGGINAHAILEECPDQEEESSLDLDQEWPAELLVISAANRASLQNRLEALAKWVEEARGVTLLDVAASCARESGPCRMAIVGKSLEELPKRLRHAVKLLAQPDRDQVQDRSGMFWYDRPLAKHGRVAFVFPGEGCQYVNMLTDLARHFPQVRREFDRTDTAFMRLGEPLSRLIFPAPGREREAEEKLLQLEGAVGSVIAASRSLLALLDGLGIKPDTVVGHSSGQFMALYAAGAYKLDGEQRIIDSIALGAETAAKIYRSSLAPNAVLTSVGGADPAAVEEAVATLGGKLLIAMDNCPHQLVLSGDEKSTDKALAILKGKGGLCERLPWGRAYHTPAFAPACGILDEYYRAIGLDIPTTELWSCAIVGKYPTRDREAVRELAVRQWCSKVRFRETIQAMYEDGVRVFVEIGPRGNLSAFIDDTLMGQAHVAAPLDLRRKNGIEQLCRAVGMLVAHGVDADLGLLFSRRRPHLVDLHAAPPGEPRRDPVLRTALPRFRLSDELIHDTQSNKIAEGQHHGPIHASASPRIPEQPTAGSTPVKNNTPDNPPAGESRFTPNHHRDETTARPPVGGPIPATRPESGQPPISPTIQGNPTGSTAAPLDARARAFAEYQETMRQFLEVQRSVMLPNPNVRGKEVSTPPAVFDGKNPVAPASPPKPEQHAASAGRSPAAKPVGGGVGPSSARMDNHPVALTPPPVPSAHAPAGHESASGSASTASLQERLLAIVSERTGYPVEMLDVKANLEADLGIDSIKRVEIIGAFRRQVVPGLDEAPAWFAERMSDARTLTGIVEGVGELAAKSSGNGNGRNAHATTAAPSVESSPSPGVQSQGQEQPRVADLPFIQTIVEHEQGRRLVVECEIDADHAPFLDDHTFFGRNLSVSDPSIKGLPVMPLAMTLEFIAEAAATLRPDLQVTALRDIRTMQWLAFPTALRRIRAEAVVVNDSDIQVRVYEADRDRSGGNIAEATVEVNRQIPPLGPPVVPDLAETQWRHEPESIYNHSLFHGPSYQGIRRVERRDARGVCATVVEPDTALMFPPGHARRLILPVALIDTAGHVAGMEVVGHWEPEDDAVHLVFPNYYERIEFKPDRPPNTPLKAVATVRKDKPFFYSEVEMSAGDGQVYLRVLGRKSEMVDLPTGTYHYWTSPRSVTMSRDITGIFHGVPGIERCTVCESGNVGSTFLMKHHWGEGLAHMIFSRKEREIYKSRKPLPVALAEHLVGRVAAKDAVRLRRGLVGCMADVEIHPDGEGRPQVKPGGVIVGEAPLISIAHKDFSGVAAAAEPSALMGVGIDVEPLRALDRGVVQDTFNDAERELLASAAKTAKEPVEHWHLSGWCAKEAVGKALGTGVIGSPRDVRITSIDAVSGRIGVELQGRMATAYLERLNRSGKKPVIHAYRRIKGQRLIALCLLEK